MFPHSVTIVNIIDGNYYTTYVSNVFYLSDKIISQEGTGEKYSNVHRCIFSKESLGQYVPKNEFKPNLNTFTLQPNDIIVKGEISAVDSLKSINDSGFDYFLIKTINKNDYGTNYLQNIEVTD